VRTKIHFSVLWVVSVWKQEICKSCAATIPKSWGSA